MKSYKEYDREFIGDSDIAALIFVGTTKDGLKANILNFGSDGRYIMLMLWMRTQRSEITIP